MTPQKVSRIAALLLVAAAGTTAAVSAAAPAGSAGVAKITKHGVDGVHVGAGYKALHSKGKIGKIGPGCELAPNTHSAKLKPPLDGTVDFTRKKPYRVTDIAISGGARARGVGIGDTIPDIKKAYPKAKVSHKTDHTLGVTLVRIPKGGGGPLQFAVTTTSKEVVVIGVPFIAFCE
jgi:hypothetical protein